MQSFACPAALAMPSMSAQVAGCYYSAAVIYLRRTAPGEVRFRADLPSGRIKARVRLASRQCESERSATTSSHRSDDLPAEDLLNLLGFRVPMG
jgi:hypothetical protein